MVLENVQKFDEKAEVSVYDLWNFCLTDLTSDSLSREIQTLLRWKYHIK